MNDVLVTRILFEGKKAVGIELIQKGITKRFRAGHTTEYTNHKWNHLYFR